MQEAVVVTPKKKKRPLSKMRKKYIVKLVLRCLVFIAAIACFIWKREWLEPVAPGNFFKSFSPVHLLWIVWMFHMLEQLIPSRKSMPLGSHKLFKERYQPLPEKLHSENLRNYVKRTTKAAYWVLAIWVAFAIVLGTLYHLGILSAAHMFLITVAFYVCDLICVVIWCPFRLLLRTRCCTTCRIFNWDHMMMFTPMMFLNSFFSSSLVLMSFVVLVVWELAFMMYPERFWEHTNKSLKCAECTDKLCTQFCKHQKHMKGIKD